MQKLFQIFMLCLILFLGFVLRYININFPPIGYHNMKENEYLSMAHDIRAGSGKNARGAYLNGAFDDESAIRTNHRPSIMPYQILLSWNILGESIQAARLSNVFFGTLSIVVIYYISLLLFESVTLSLFCAFLLSILPLGVFFSRNIQAESPAFFFMLLSNLFYLRFVFSLKRYDLFLGSISLSLAWSYEYRFIVGLLPFAFCFPFKSLYKNKKDFAKFLIGLLIPFLITSCVMAWLEHLGLLRWDFFTSDKLRPWEIFTYKYWSSYGKTIWWYAAGENFTFIYIFLAACGIAAAFSRRKGVLNRYIMGWSAALIIYGIIFSDFITQHNYSQMPFLLLVSISTGYGVLFISQKLVIKSIPKTSLFLPVVVISTSLSAPFVYSAILRMHSTVYLGLDVAGESLREFTGPDERIFLSTHAQGKSITRYARRRMGWADSMEDFKNKEAKFNVRYICFYPAEFALALKSNNPELFEYIRNSYHAKEVGLTEEQNQLYYIILEKGRSLHPETFLQSFSGPKQERMVYKMFGNHRFFYSLRPPVESDAVN